MKPVEAPTKSYSTGHSATIDEALENAGFGKFNVFLVITCGLILYAVNSECYSIGYVLPAAECDLGLNVNEKSILTSIGFVGILTGQFLWGFISDTRGRKNCLLYTLALSFLSTVASTLAPYLWLFALFRFLNGLLISCSSATVFAYLGEFISNKHRSPSIIAACIFTGLAITVIPALAWLILPIKETLQIFNFTLHSWRLFVLLCAVPTALACALLFFFPESPKFLLQNNQSEKAIKILRKIKQINSNTEFGIESIEKENSVELKGNLLLQFLKQMFALFKIEHLKNTVLACTLQFGTFATSSGLLLWYPDIVVQLSKSSDEITTCNAIVLARNTNFSETEKNCDSDIDTSVYELNLWIGAFYLVGYLVVSFVINLFGAKAIIAVFLGISCISCGALYWITNKLAIDVLFITFLVLSGLSVGIINAAIVDLFPTNLRAMAMCMALFFGRLGSVVSSSIVGHLLNWNCDATFFIYAASLLICTILAFFIPNGQNERIVKSKS